MNNVTIIKETSPHLRRKDSLFRMLLDVLIALFPVQVMALVAYTWRAVVILLISFATMVCAEIVSVLIKNRIPYDGTKHTLKEQLKKGFSAVNINHIMAPLVSAEIFALIMPAQSDPAPVIYIATFVGALAGIVLGKLVFGGTGQNIFNPAAVGMVFAKICFGSRYVYDGTYYVTAVSTGGTPLSNAIATTSPGLPDLLGHYTVANDYSFLDLFLGRIPGTIGEGFKFAILIGLVYLLIRRAADHRVIVSFFVTFIGLMAIAGIFVAVRVPGVSWFHFMVFQLFSGGVIFGGVFMVTDPVTMPINSPGRIMYGTLCGALVVLIRIFGALPEGMAFAILLSNMLAPVIDYHAWSSQKITVKKIIWIGAIVAVAAIIICLALGLGGRA